MDHLKGKSFIHEAVASIFQYLIVGVNLELKINYLIKISLI